MLQHDNTLVGESSGPEYPALMHARSLSASVLENAQQLPHWLWSLTCPIEVHAGHAVRASNVVGVDSSRWLLRREVLGGRCSRNKCPSMPATSPRVLSANLAFGAAVQPKFCALIAAMSSGWRAARFGLKLGGWGGRPRTDNSRVSKSQQGRRGMLDPAPQSSEAQSEEGSRKNDGERAKTNRTPERGVACNGGHTAQAVTRVLGNTARRRRYMRQTLRLEQATRAGRARSKFERFSQLSLYLCAQ